MQGLTVPSLHSSMLAIIARLKTTRGPYRDAVKRTPVEYTEDARSEPG